MATNFNIEEFVNEFKKRSGFGVTGSALDRITGYLNERIPEGNVRINVPYHGFNVRGKVSVVHHDVHGVTPDVYLAGHYDEVVDVADTTTLYYGDIKAGKGNYIPFLSDCDVYFVDDCKMTDGTLVINLIKGPNWRMYL